MNHPLSLWLLFITETVPVLTHRILRPYCSISVRAVTDCIQHFSRVVLGLLVSPIPTSNCLARVQNIIKQHQQQQNVNYHPVVLFDRIILSRSCVFHVSDRIGSVSISYSNFGLSIRRQNETMNTTQPKWKEKKRNQHVSSSWYNIKTKGIHTVNDQRYNPSQ